MDDENKKLIHFKSSIFGENNDDIYNIVSKNSGRSSVLIDNTISILNLIETTKIDYVKKKSLLADIISRKTHVDSSIVNTVLDLILSLDFAEIVDNIFTLSPIGKLFLMSDSTSQYVDILRYFFERAEWKHIVPRELHDKFVYKEARRYIACMLSRISSEKFKCIEMYSSNKTKGITDVVFSADYNAYRELLHSDAVKYILANIFEKMGLVIFNNKSSMEEFRLSETGKKIFEFYSYGMIDEYKSMIDECWDSYDRGNFQEALDNALSIIKVVGIIPEALNVIGCVYIKKNEFTAAEEIFNFALDICTDNVLDMNMKNSFYAETYISLYYNLGLCCVSMGEFFRALHIFNSIKKTVPYEIESLDDITKEVKKLIIIA